MYVFGKNLYLLASSVALLSGTTKAQFPRACTTDEALTARECCPVLEIGGMKSKCGEQQGRGACVNIQVLPKQGDLNTTQLALDERINWPIAFYDKACLCYGNFDGVNCDQCKPGFTGTKCNQSIPVFVRKNFTKMSKPEVEEFITNLNKSKYIVSEKYVILTTTYDSIRAGNKPVFSNVSVYDVFVWMHYYVARGRDQNYAHEGPAFLPWHRYFMLKWEDELRRNVVKDPNFAIPYWDWRDSETCEVCTNDMLGARSTEKPELLSPDSSFSKWEVICTKSDDEDYALNDRQCDGTPEGPLLRNYGAYDTNASTGLPTSLDVENALKFSSYDTFPYNSNASKTFRNVVEGFAEPSNGDGCITYSTMHNAVHLYLNGTMSKVISAANDPIFVLHHAFIDSIYEIWLRNQSRQDLFFGIDSNREFVKQGHNLQDFMVPFFPLVRIIEGFRTTEELHYKYDYAASGYGSEVIDNAARNPPDVLEYICGIHEEATAEGFSEELVCEGAGLQLWTEGRLCRVRYLKPNSANVATKKCIVDLGEAGQKCAQGYICLPQGLFVVIVCVCSIVFALICAGVAILCKSCSEKKCTKDARSGHNNETYANNDSMNIFASTTSLVPNTT